MKRCLYNCSQNCWIDWNSAVLCFKRLFHIGVWTFSWFVRPLYMGNLVPAYTIYHVFPCWQNNKKDGRKKARHRTDFETDQWTETGDIFWLYSGLYCYLYQGFQRLSIICNVFLVRSVCLENKIWQVPESVSGKQTNKYACKIYECEFNLLYSNMGKRPLVWVKSFARDIFDELIQI